MKLSTRSRYGLRALLELALHYGEGPIQLKKIAKNQQISLQYLEQLIRPLLAAGFIKSIRGVNGGIWLSKSPSMIKLGAIIEHLEGKMAPVECVTDPNVCGRSENCVTRDIWCELKSTIYGVLNSVTLQELIIRHKNKRRKIKKVI